MDDVIIHERHFSSTFSWIYNIILRFIWFVDSLTFHSDRGKQYTSATFTVLLQKCEVKQSFSATARPHDNAVAETFFASFKKEEAYHREYTSEQSYRKSVEQYIRFYNELRPHRTLKYKTPQAFEEAYRERL